MLVDLYIKRKSLLESELAATGVVLLVVRGAMEPVIGVWEREVRIVTGPPVLPRCSVILRCEGVAVMRVRPRNWNRPCRGRRRQDCEITVNLGGENEARGTYYKEVAGR